MAIRMIDTVYQTVLAIANKEQRGYITPLEFNLFANHAQADIFEQYFYDLNQFKRVPGNQSDYADITDAIEEKIARFITTTNITQTTTGVTLPEDVYKLSTIVRDSASGEGGKICEIMPREQANKVTSGGRLTQPTMYQPICYRMGKRGLEIRPTPNNPISIYVSYIRKPKHPKWTYLVINDKALWHSGAEDMQDFELHPSEQENLVVKILKLAGVSIKDPGVVQAALAEEGRNVQQEKL